MPALTIQCVSCSFCFGMAWYPGLVHGRCPNCGVLFSLQAPVAPPAPTPLSTLPSPIQSTPMFTMHITTRNDLPQGFLGINMNVGGFSPDLQASIQYQHLQQLEYQQQVQQHHQQQQQELFQQQQLQQQLQQFLEHQLLIRQQQLQLLEQQQFATPTTASPPPIDTLRTSHSQSVVDLDVGGMDVRNNSPTLGDESKRTCRCGSTLHQRTTHRACPMNAIGRLAPIQPSGSPAEGKILDPTTALSTMAKSVLSTRNSIPLYADHHAVALWVAQSLLFQDEYTDVGLMGTSNETSACQSIKEDQI